jgi:hypothetical protein
MPYEVMNPATIANVGFVLAFPGFFYYQIAKSVGLIDYEIGLIVEVYILTSAAFAFLASGRVIATVNRTPFIGGFALLLFLYCAATVGVVVALIDIPTEAVIQSGVLLVSWLALFLIALFLDLEGRWLRRILWLASAGVVVLTLVSAGSGIRLRAAFVDPDDVATYQGYARSAAIMSAALLAITAGTLRRLATAMLSLVVLFLIGARSELFGMAFAIVALEGLLILKRGRNAIWLSIATVVLLALVFFYFDLIQSSRQLEVLNLSQSNSWIMRQEFSDFAWNQVRHSPIVGRFGGHFEYAGSAGSYAHSALSAWVSFGLAGFLLYVGLSMAAAIASAQGVLHRDSPQWRMAFYVSTSSLLLIAVAKPVFWPIPAFAWGLAAAARLAEKGRSAGTTGASSFQRRAPV